jgi:Putative zinc-finger
MTEWHAPQELLTAYVDGRLDAIDGASLERHVERCADCRARIAPFADAPRLENVWDAVRERVEEPQLPWLLRQAGRLGLSEPTGILLAAAASLRAAWLSGAFIALGFAVAAAMASGDALWPFLLVAPLIPVLGVAMSYGSFQDSFEALSATTPYGRTRLVVVRTLAVLVTTVPAACLLGLALPGPTWVAAAWLGPALALLSVLLSLATFLGPRLAAPIVALVWCGVVLGSVRHLPATWPVQATQQLAYAAVAAVALTVLLVRARQTRQIGAVL